MVELEDEWEDRVVGHDEVSKRRCQIGHGEHAALTASWSQINLFSLECRSSLPQDEPSSTIHSPLHSPKLRSLLLPSLLPLHALVLGPV